jgi:hypothetical protein
VTVKTCKIVWRAVNRRDRVEESREMTP